MSPCDFGMKGGGTKAAAPLRVSALVSSASVEFESDGPDRARQNVSNDEPRPSGADGHDSLSTDRFHLDSNSKLLYFFYVLVLLFWPCESQKKERFTITREVLGGASEPATQGFCKNGTKHSLLPLSQASLTQAPCSLWISQSRIQLNGFWLYRLIFQSQSATDSPAPQHHKTENKRSARQLSVGKRWQVCPAAAAAGLETIWPNSPDEVAIYQADCNEQKHYQGTFCPPLNSVSVLCHYLVSVALRDRPA